MQSETYDLRRASFHGVIGSSKAFFALKTHGSRMIRSGFSFPSGATRLRSFWKPCGELGVLAELKVADFRLVRIAEINHFLSR